MSKKIIIDNKKTIQFMLIIIVSLVISILIFFFEMVIGGYSFGSGNEKEPIIFLSKKPELLIWLFMGMIQIIFCLNILPHIIKEVKELLIHFSISFNSTTTLVVLVLLFLLSTLLSTIFAGNAKIPQTLQENNLINHAKFKLSFIVILSYIVICICIYILLLIYSLTNSIKKPNYFDFIILKRKLNTVLNVTGFILTMSTIATALLQEVLSDDHNFPKQFVYSYGLFNTLYIGLIYLPVFFIVNSWGEATIQNELITKFPPDKDPELFLKNKNTYHELFELNEDYLTIIKKAVPILAPLIASLFSYAGFK